MFSPARDDDERSAMSFTIETDAVTAVRPTARAAEHSALAGLSLARSRVRRPARPRTLLSFLRGGEVPGVCGVRCRDCGLSTD
jgi:hypothetical protein